MRIGDLLNPGRKTCFSTFNLESGFLGQKYGHNILLFPGATPMYWGTTTSPMVFLRPRGVPGVTGGERVVDGFSTKVMKGRKGSF